MIPKNVKNHSYCAIGIISVRKITIKLDQKQAKKCYENNLKTKRGVFMVTTRAPIEEGDMIPIARYR